VKKVFAVLIIMTLLFGGCGKKTSSLVQPNPAKEAAIPRDVRIIDWTGKAECMTYLAAIGCVAYGIRKGKIDVSVLILMLLPVFVF
jgi:hypothetical protein